MYFPTNACNLNCAICWQRKGVHDYSELSQERQRTLIDEAIALGVRELVIGGGGEPLVRWENLRPLFTKARNSGLYGMLFTNGTLISEDVAASLVEMKWNKVLISLDGLQGVNDTVREPGSFERILKGLDCLLTARGRQPLPIIGVGCVMTHQGAEELPEFVRLLANSGCDQLNLIRLVVHLDEQRHFMVNHSKIADFQRSVREAREVAHTAGIVTNLGEYLDEDTLSQTESFDSVLLSKRTLNTDGNSFWGALCFEPFSNLVIHANGMVGPCCMCGDAPVASIVSRTLSDVWFGDEFGRLRQGSLNRCPEPYCRICDVNVFAENQRLRSIGAETDQCLK
ncbi:MAG: radical SAM/SPASM domain-containing protein [Desulfuromonadaceae bacterium]